VTNDIIPGYEHEDYLITTNTIRTSYITTLINKVVNPPELYYYLNMSMGINTPYEIETIENVLDPYSGLSNLL